jgi:hypothetical protein
MEGESMSVRERRGEERRGEERRGEERRGEERRGEGCFVICACVGGGRRERERERERERDARRSNTRGHHTCSILCTIPLHTMHHTCSILCTIPAPYYAPYLFVHKLLK